MTPSLDGRSDKLMTQRGMDTGTHDLWGTIIKTIYVYALVYEAGRNYVPVMACLQ